MHPWSYKPWRTDIRLWSSFIILANGQFFSLVTVYVHRAKICFYLAKFLFSMLFWVFPLAVPGTIPEDLRGLAVMDPNSTPSTAQRRETSTGSKNAACAAGILQRWLQNRDVPELRRIEEIPPVELDAYLFNFFGSVTKTNGGDYDHRSWRNLRSNIDRYLREHGYAHAISHSSLFQKSRGMFLQRQESLKVAAARCRSNSSPKDPQSISDIAQRSREWPPIMHRTAPQPTGSQTRTLTTVNNVQQKE